MAKIEPKILKGFRDFLPDKQIARQKMIKTIQASYETFGFEPLETPVLEYAEILTGKYGDEGDKLMYRFKDNGDRDVAMRYDLTIPLARVIAQYGDIKKPFKRYQIAPVWRADNTQKGRFREFYQCDADIVGSASPLADAEILALAGNTLKRLGASNFVIRVNSREIISAFYESLKLSDKEKTSAMRAVDKMDKIGENGVAEELAAAGLSKQVPAIIEFAKSSIEAFKLREDPLVLAKKFPAIKEPLAKLVGILEYAYKLSPETVFYVDLSIARGLDYYTGLIFETNLSDAPQFGSVLSGGRYDNLVGMFSSKPLPAVGASIGLDRLMAALEELKLIQTEGSVAKALIVNFDENLTEDYLRMASDLRNAGVNTILYFETTDLKKQLSFASSKGIRYALIYGSNEKKSGKITLKDLEKGTQKEIGWSDLASLR